MHLWVLLSQESVLMAPPNSFRRNSLEEAGVGAGYSISNVGNKHLAVDLSSHVNEFGAVWSSLEWFGVVWRRLKRVGSVTETDTAECGGMGSDIIACGQRQR